MKCDVRLSPPWYTYQRQVQAMFNRDPQVFVRDLQPTEAGDYILQILVKDQDKADAIRTLLKTPPDFGPKITLSVIGPKGEAGVINLESRALIEAAFAGNPIFAECVVNEIPSHKGQQIFCVFAKEVIQFWNDDISDLYGNWNGLAADIAREIFDRTGAMFCTNIS